MAYFLRMVLSGVVAYCDNPMGGSGSKLLAARHVVIVGGGYGGIAVANQLTGKCKFTLIDPKECFHHNLGALRSCVEKGFVKKTFVPYKPTYGEHFKRGKVIRTDVTTKKVVLEGGEEIPYDYLVLATGTTGYFPCKLNLSMKEIPSVLQMYDGVVEKIKTARDIVIIGGGPAGIELSGEIITDLKDKKVTLIHSKPGLINNGDFTDQFRKSLHEKLVKHGVEVLLEHRVTNLKELPQGELKRCNVRTDKGKEVTADLVFVCTGMKTNTAAYADTLGEKMDDIGCLKVDEHLRVEGMTDVFAIGDCCTADSQAKMAMKAGRHGQIVAENIQLDVDGKSLKPYKPSGAIMAVPIGRNSGVTQFGSWVMGDFVSKMMKGKDLLVPRYWSAMKQTMPNK